MAQRFIYCLSFILLQNFTFCQKWFSQETIDCTVLLCVKINNEITPHGVGFLIYNYNNPNYYTVVTCKHVIENQNEIFLVLKASPTLIEICHNYQKNEIDFGGTSWNIEKESLITNIELIKNVTFCEDSTKDIAAFPIEISARVAFKEINKDSLVSITNVKGIPKTMICKKSGVSLGDDIFFLGFPNMIGTKNGFRLQNDIKDRFDKKFKDEVSNPVLRSGIIAWISKINDEFLLDAWAYSGNSGSPIFRKQSATNNGPVLIGMVSGHLYESMITTKNSKNGKTKSIDEFSGNFGLARGIWIDDILNVVKRAEKLKLQ